MYNLVISNKPADNVTPFSAHRYSGDRHKERIYIYTRPVLEALRSSLIRLAVAVALACPPFGLKPNVIQPCVSGQIVSTL